MGKYIKIVYFKEMMDTLRDKKTLLTTLLLPLVIYPLMFGFMNGAIGDMVTAGEEKTVVAVLGSDKVKEVLSVSPGLTVQDSADPMKSLKDGEVSVVLRGTELPGGKLQIDVIYDDKKNSSSLSMSYISGLIQQYNQASVHAELAAMGIDLDTMNPVSQSIITLTDETGVQDGGNAGMMLSMMVPMLLVVLLAVGGMATASDLFAGEKERKTMEPLLCTRAGRSAILTGKLLTVTTFALLNVAASVTGLLLSYVVSPNVFSLTNEVTGSTERLSLPIPVVMLTVLLVLLMALVFSGLHVVIATYARTAKESATYGTFVMLASYIPVFSMMFMGAGDIKRWMMLVPVLNVSGSLKMLLGGITDYVFLGGSIAVSLVFLLLVMALARWMFSKETVMIRTTG